MTSSFNIPIVKITAVFDDFSLGVSMAEETRILCHVKSGSFELGYSISIPENPAFSSRGFHSVTGMYGHHCRHGSSPSHHPES